MTAVTPSRVESSFRDLITNRIKQRIRVKRGPMSPPFELEYRHIFVLPTLFGWGFAAMLVLMALGGLNFNNNMALMLVFILGAIAQLTTFIAYRNLSGLKIDSVYCEPVFCGESANFHVFISNGNERQRFAVQAGFKQALDCTDFKLDSSESLRLKYPSVTRGWLEMPSFRLETRFPLGLFKAWSWIFPDTRCLVYPSPARNAPALPETGHGQSGQAAKGDGDEVHGLRKYQPGDSMQHIAWRASARHNELYSLEMEAPREEACELDWNLLPGIDIETRLSILTAWVIAADHKLLTYSLTLPDQHIRGGSGIHHRAKCLELLALYLQ